MKEQFISKTFRSASLELVAQVNTVLTTYGAQGYKLTLRQLYYQLVAADLIPNNLRSYKRLGNIVGDARLAGLIDWAMIEDRERPVVYPGHWEHPGDILQTAIHAFRLDRWADQPRHVEVMVEKKALEGVLIPVCQGLDVRFTAQRGYSSLSAMYAAGQRIRHATFIDKEVWILYLGDHDPSGMDMDRDITERGELLSGSSLALRRLALLWEQIEELNLPENPTKLSDSRAGAYVAEFGMASWELDAIEPGELARLVREAVTSLRDDDLWDATMARETEMKDELKEFAATYDDTEED